MVVFVHDDTVIDIIESLGMVAVTDTGGTGYFHCDVCENDTLVLSICCQRVYSITRGVTG